MDIKKNDQKDDTSWDMSTCTINVSLQKMLIEQMSHELYNHNLYRTFASFYSANGLIKLSEYYSKRAQEEYNHYLWCVDFAQEVGMIYETPPVDAIDEDWQTDLIQPFKVTLDVEIETTEMIYDMVDKARSVKDEIFLSWLFRPKMLVEEQLEEVDLSRKALKIMTQDDSMLSKQDAIEHLYGN